MRSPDHARPSAPAPVAGGEPGIGSRTSGLDTCSDVLGRLRLHAALPAAEFDLRFLAPIERLAMGLAPLAGHAPAVPAAESGCTLRLCTEAAFHSFQAADGHIFSGRCSVQSRHLLEARWRYLCFAAGLLHFPHRIAGNCASAASIIGVQNLGWLDAGGSRLSMVLRQVVQHPGGPAAPPAAAPEAVELAEGRIRAARLVEGVARRLWLRDGRSVPGFVLAQANCPPMPSTAQPGIRDPLQARRLADLADACRKLPMQGHPSVARTAEGLALAVDFLVPIVRDLPRWAEAMAEAGLIHCAPDSPGRRLVPWVFTPGADARPAIVLSDLACRRLGL